MGVVAMMSAKLKYLRMQRERSRLSSCTKTRRGGLAESGGGRRKESNRVKAGSDVSRRKQGPERAWNSEL